MSEKARKFLSGDRKLKSVIKTHGAVSLKKRRDYFNILAMSIVYQQLSGAAAGTIYGRLKAKCGGKVRPNTIQSLSIPIMRKCGLSRQKISYIRDLSKRFTKKEINPRKFHTLSDQKIIDELVAVRGIGRWTAEMFLIFSLGREDVFPADDLGIKRAIQKIYGVQDVSQKNLDKFSKRWSPYRSYASLYLWKSGDIKPPKNW